jgi:ferric-dicitrate binding protein FerR (iron transport regulator)
MELPEEIIHKLVEDKNTEQEWKHFETNEVLEPAISHRMLLAVQRHTFKRHTVRRIVVRASAIAACFVLAIMAIDYLSIDLKEKATLSGTHHNNNIIRNEGNAKKIITLADNSRVILYTNSTLHIDSNFNTSSRKMRIEGEADFFVAHDPDRPFIVAAGNYSTTALGTSFKVIYHNEEQELAVRLMTGRVSVERKAGGSNTLLCYLVPGQQVNVNLKNQQFIVKEIRDVSKKPVKYDTHKSNKKTLPSSTILVEKESLTLLLHRLSKQFDTVIAFDEKELNSMSVTATFKNESLEEILEQIAILNDLSYERKGSGYLISKK